MQVNAGPNDNGGRDEKDDQQAELIAALTAEEADRLWLRLIHLKPYFND
jgi:hypothetical protein